MGGGNGALDLSSSSRGFSGILGASAVGLGDTSGSLLRRAGAGLRRSTPGAVGSGRMLSSREEDERSRSARGPAGALLVYNTALRI